MPNRDSLRKLEMSDVVLAHAAFHLMEVVYSVVVRFRANHLRAVGVLLINISLGGVAIREPYWGG